MRPWWKPRSGSTGGCRLCGSSRRSRDDERMEGIWTDITRRVSAVLEDLKAERDDETELKR